MGVLCQLRPKNRVLVSPDTCSPLGTCRAFIMLAIVDSKMPKPGPLLTKAQQAAGLCSLQLHCIIGIYSLRFHLLSARCSSRPRQCAQWPEFTGESSRASHVFMLPTSSSLCQPSELVNHDSDTSYQLSSSFDFPEPPPIYRLHAVSVALFGGHDGHWRNCELGRPGS